MSTENIYLATIAAIDKRLPSATKLNHLDIGSGSGELIRKLQGLKHEITSSACDYIDSLMKLKDQKVDIVDLNKNKLPYNDKTFDIVTATEIIEHLENPRSFLRDINRILKPGGVCVLSTPNVLNLNSRLRYLWFGFPQLFGPLPIDARKIESCSGHISSISYFYIYHALRESGFIGIDFKIDKYQRSGLAKLLLLYLPIKIKAIFIKRKEASKYQTIDRTNIEVVNQMNSLKILLGRTIIVTANKEISHLSSLR
jgi:ubiquinone/menaquinone biosynthesis C-methylase UbiE